MSEWKECELLDEMEPQINTDGRRCEIMHLCSSTVFLYVQDSCDQEATQG